MPSILITGTDSGIGKTHVAGIIERLLAKQGRVQVVKPVESVARFPKPVGRAKVAA